MRAPDDFDLTLEHLLRDGPIDRTVMAIRTDVKLRARHDDQRSGKPLRLPRYLRNHPDYWKALCDLDAPAEL